MSQPPGERPDNDRSADDTGPIPPYPGQPPRDPAPPAREGDQGQPGYGGYQGQQYGGYQGQPAYGGYQGQPGSYGYPGQPPSWAPYGVHPMTGVPYSDKSKLVAGLLQVLLPLGIGRMYAGYTGLGVAQLIVTLITCGVGAIWPFVDGIILLLTDSRDAQGRMLRT